MDGEMKYHTFSTSQPPRRKLPGPGIHLLAGTLAVVVLVGVVMGLRSGSSRTELIEMSFPGVGKMLSNWVSEWGRLSNVGNIDGIQLQKNVKEEEEEHEEVAAIKAEKAHAMHVSHLNKAAQLHRANGWIFDAKGDSKGYLFHAPKREGWMERAPREKAWMERAPTEKGWMFIAPTEKEPRETTAAEKRHAEGWMFDTKEAKAPVLTKAALRKQAEGWMFSLPSQNLAARSASSPVAAKKAPTKDVGAAWKQWASHEAAAKHEDVHRIAVGPGGWEVFIDAKTERPFYFNRAQGVSSWTSPWSAKETQQQLQKAALSSSSSSSSSSADSASKALEHLPVSGLEAVQAQPPHLVSGQHRAFGVVEQEGDMNAYFDALQRRIDHGIDARNNKLIQQRGLARWLPAPDHRLARREQPAPLPASVGAPPHALASPPLPLPAAAKRRAPPSSAAAAAASASAVGFGAEGHVPPAAAGSPRRAGLAAAGRMQAARAAGARSGGAQGAGQGKVATAAAAAERAMEHLRRVEGALSGGDGGWGRGRAAVPRRREEKAQVLRGAWDTMEGGEGSDLMARIHV